MVETLVHEMIHAYIYVYTYADGLQHGRLFNAEKRRIMQLSALDASTYDKGNQSHIQHLQWKWKWTTCGKVILRINNKAAQPMDSGVRIHRRTCQGRWIKIKQNNKRR